MLPSSSDRQPWQTLAIFIGVVAAVVVFLNGGVPQLSNSVLAGLTHAIDLLALAFTFTLLVDIVFITGIYVVEQILIALQES
jgi:hypothetical protein